MLFALRFMIDCDVVGGNWVELPAGSYRESKKQMSYCQLDVDIQYPAFTCTIIIMEEVISMSALSCDKWYVLCPQFALVLAFTFAPTSFLFSYLPFLFFCLVLANVD